MGWFSGITDFIGNAVGGLADWVGDNVGDIAAAGANYFLPGSGSLVQGLLEDDYTPGEDYDYGNEPATPAYNPNAMPITISGSNPMAGISDSLGQWVKRGLDSGSVWSAGASGLAALASGGLGYLGQSSANAANQQNVESQIAFQERANQKAMDFSERMANTQWQRGVQDMSAAGINPMLAYSKGGASAPSGVTSAGAAATMQNAMAPALTSAVSAMQGLAQVDYIRAQTDRTRIQAAHDAALFGKTTQEEITSQSAEEVNRKQAVRIDEEIKRIRAEVVRIAKQNDLTEAETSRVLADIPNVVLRGGQIRADTANANANAALRNLEIPGAKNRAEAESSWFKREVSPYLGDLGSITGSAARAARTFQ